MDATFSLIYGSEPLKNKTFTAEAADVAVKGSIKGLRGHWGVKSALDSSLRVLILCGHVATVTH